MTTTQYPHPTLPFTKKSIPKVCTGSQHVHDCFVNNAGLLGTPSIPLATLQTQITDLVNANQAMKSNKAAGPAREVKLDALWITIGSYQLFVDQLCAAHPDQASAYIAASGFSESKVADRNLVALVAEATNVPGQVELVIHSSLLETPKNKPSAKRTHLLRHTLDGKTYVTDDPTSGARALINNLPTLVPIVFEVAAKDASGVSAWAQAVQITLTK
jgi:hypothetical protein